MARTPDPALFDDEMVLLLKAALMAPAPALAAFREWRARFDIDAIADGKMRLLPLVHANVAAQAGDDVLLGRLKGIRKYWWLRNQLFADGAAKALRTLAEATIPTILLKGAAMVAGWYRDAALRPMNDVDVLVPTGDAVRAIRALVAAGWAPIGGSADALCEFHIHRLHAWNFVTARGHALDLHWHALSQMQQNGADEPLWRDARPCTIAGASTSMLAPAEQLFHVLAHGLPAKREDVYMWPADAVWIIRRDAQEFDWPRVVALAQGARLTLPIAAGLRFLRDTLAVAGTDAAIAALERSPARWIERREFALRGKIAAARGRFGTAVMQVQSFRRRSGDLIARPVSAAILPLLQERWSIDRPAATLGYALAVALRRPAALKPLWLVGPRARRIAALRPRPLALDTLPLAAAPDDSLVHGWHIAEHGGRWTAGAEAVIALALAAPPSADLLMTADATPLLHGRQRRVAVDVWIGTHFAARWRAHRDRGWLQPCECAIPAAWLAGNDRLVVTFVVRRPRRPADIGGSKDDRLLGLFVRSLRFAALDAQAGAPKPSQN